jgi:hypothetical protein
MRLRRFMPRPKRNQKGYWTNRPPSAKLWTPSVLADQPFTKEAQYTLKADR